MLLPAVVEFLQHVYTYTFQITDEALILRHFPNERSPHGYGRLHLWNQLQWEEGHCRYQVQGHPQRVHHFHSKQVGKVLFQPHCLNWEKSLISTTRMGLIPLEEVHSHSKHFEGKRRVPYNTLGQLDPRARSCTFHHYDYVSVSCSSWKSTNPFKLLSHQEAVRDYQSCNMCNIHSRD